MANYLVIANSDSLEDTRFFVIKDPNPETERLLIASNKCIINSNDNDFSPEVCEFVVGFYNPPYAFQENQLPMPPVDIKEIDNLIIIGFL